MESGINEGDKGGTMERTSCKKCKCWNTKHPVYDNFKNDPGFKRGEVGICERHAPRQHYLNQVAMGGGPVKMFPGCLKAEGCWEGIPKK